jgi:hypothetical protein
MPPCGQTEKEQFGLRLMDTSARGLAVIEIVYRSQLVSRGGHSLCPLEKQDD